jgi:uncharacterized NAD(P)/FAD-binding protein YdhS
VANEVIVNTRVTRQQLEKMVRLARAVAASVSEVTAAGQVEFMKGRTQALEECVQTIALIDMLPPCCVAH